MITRTELRRSFGRFTLVGTHVINTIHKFLYQPVTKRDKEAAAAAAAKKARKKGNLVESRKRRLMGGRGTVTNLPIASILFSL